MFLHEFLNAFNMTKEVSQTAHFFVCSIRYLGGDGGSGGGGGGGGMGV
jgi:hypothetical protein